MSPRQTDPRRGNEPLDVRLRVDPNAIGEARWYLAEIDRTVFAAAESHGPDRQVPLIKGAVAALFGRD